MSDLMMRQTFVAPESMRVEDMINEYEFWFHWIDFWNPDKELRGLSENVALLTDPDPTVQAYGRRTRWKESGQ